MRFLLKLFVIAFVILSSCKSITQPDQLINQRASLPQTFKLSDLHQSVITTFINKREHITGILYGNEKAYLAANATKSVEEAGESFTLITWRQQDDQHWFGARIPGDLISAETLTLTGENDAPAYHYQRYNGKELIKLADTSGTSTRIKFILTRKASIIP